jgi:60 kDa SS-A/Ro ribonucleoprotein
MTQWQEFVGRQVRLHDAGFTGPKLVCIDVQSYGTTQAPERSDVLNVGGFSDAVFHVVAAFVNDEPERFVSEVEAVEL